MIRHLVNMLLYFFPPTRLFAFRRLMFRIGRIRLGSGVCVCGRGWVYGRGPLSIGEGSWLSPGVIIHTHAEAPIRIGARCDIGPGTEFITGSHRIGGPSRRAGGGIARSISIGDGTWIGGRSIILGGVRIGEGSVIAAGSVVTRDVPPNAFVAGVPATVRKILY